jgi:glutamate/tyrosine decarboxylase-like PLP-dependent enzyme
MVLLPEGQSIRQGIAQADSVTLDPHKWFGQTFEVGCLLVREAGLLAETFHIRPDYMQDIPNLPGEVNFADHGLALTRRFRALKIWLSVKVLGVSWFRSLIQRCCELAEYAQLLLEQSPQFEILSPRQLSIICFRYLPERLGLASHVDEVKVDRLNLALVEELRATGRAFVSSTLVCGRVALRFCFVNWRTTAADVDEVVRLLKQLGDRIDR